MRVVVTGAAGFLGRAVVDAAVDAGHDVVALVRPATAADSLTWSSSVDVVRGDLRQVGPWADRLSDVEAVIHLAAAASGDFSEQFAGTVVATENLLAALDLRTVQRVVHVSSFSVYDLPSLPTHGILDESSPLDPWPERRDAYTTTKLLQEQMVRAACAQAGTDLVVVRPGAVYGPGKEWEHGAAMRVNRFALIVAPHSPMRLTYVTNCAEAIVHGVDSAGAAGGTFNVVDDDLPTHLEFFTMCRSAGGTTARPIPVPWSVVSSVGRVLAVIDRLLLGERAKLPEVLASRRQQARWKPLRYPNNRAKGVLGWTPSVSVVEGVQRMLQRESVPRG